MMASRISPDGTKVRANSIDISYDSRVSSANSAQKETAKDAQLAGSMFSQAWVVESKATLAGYCPIISHQIYDDNSLSAYAVFSASHVDCNGEKKMKCKCHHLLASALFDNCGKVLLSLGNLLLKLNTAMVLKFSLSP